jgi:hypothetical protein
MRHTHTHTLSLLPILPLLHPLLLGQDLHRQRGADDHHDAGVCRKVLPDPPDRQALPRHGARRGVVQDRRPHPPGVCACVCLCVCVHFSMQAYLNYAFSYYPAGSRSLSPLPTSSLHQLMSFPSRLFPFSLSQAPMKVGGHYITTSITVLEQKSGPQFIFGLDNLKRHLVR